MPTYDYECTSCLHTLETFQSMQADPLTECPSCGAPSLRRIISGGTGVIFKGSGFYVNDSRGSSKAADAGSGDAAASGGTKTEDGAKTDSTSSKQPTTAATSDTAGTPAKSTASQTA